MRTSLPDVIVMLITGAVLAGAVQAGELHADNSAGDPVQVERHTQPGPDRVTAELTVKAELRQVQAALETPCAVRQWLPGTQTIQVLQADGRGLTRVRMVTDFPWPWKDRVAVLAFERTQPGPDRLLIRMQAVDSEVESSDLVVVRHSTASWQLEKIGPRVRIQYQQRFNPAGTVPQWLADRVAGTKVKDALENLRTLLEHNQNRDPACRWRADPDPAVAPGDRRAP